MLKLGVGCKQSDPLPQFYEARSKLILVETRKSKQLVASGTPEALAVKDKSATKGKTDPVPPQPAQPPVPQQQQQTDQQRSGNNGRGRGFKGRGGRGRGRGGFRPWVPTQWWQNSNPAWFQQQQWAPPSPFPTTAWPRPSPSPAPGLLGPRPGQAMHATVPDQNYYVPTNIATAMQTMSLNVPQDQWFMDSGASSHMTAASGQTDRQNSPAMQ